MEVCSDNFLIHLVVQIEVGMPKDITIKGKEWESIQYKVYQFNGLLPIHKSVRYMNHTHYHQTGQLMICLLYEYFRCTKL